MLKHDISKFYKNIFNWKLKIWIDNYVEVALEDDEIRQNVILTTLYISHKSELWKPQDLKHFPVPSLHWGSVPQLLIIHFVTFVQIIEVKSVDQARMQALQLNVLSQMLVEITPLQHCSTNVVVSLYLPAVQTISLTQLHLPPTGSNARYEGHW